MIKYYKEELIIPDYIYNEIKECLETSSGNLTYDFKPLKFKDGTLCCISVWSYYSPYVEFQVHIKVETLGVLHTETFKFKKMNFITNVFKFEINLLNSNYLVKMNKKYELTINNCKDILELVLENSIKDKFYLERLLEYSDFNNKFDLLQATYSILLTLDKRVLLKGKQLSKEYIDKLKQYILHKYEFFGYDDDFALNVTNGTLNWTTASSGVLNEMISSIITTIEDEADFDNLRRSITKETMRYLTLREFEVGLGKAIF